MDGTRSLISGNELMLYGPVFADAMPGEGIRALDVIDSLRAIKGDVIVARINSPGGSVTEGIAIYNALRADSRKVVVRIDAMAASIASVIALAGDERIIAENASVMIHDPWIVAIGSSSELRATADEVDRQRDIILGIYETRTGLSRDQLSAMMARETFMGASDALELGFVTGIEEALKIAALAPLTPTELARFIGLPTSDAVRAPIPAASAASHPEKETTMALKPDQVAVADASAEVTHDLAAIRAEAASAERKRVSDIYAMAANGKVDKALADRLVEDGTPLAAAKEAIFDAWVSNPAAGPEIGPSVRVVRDATETRAKGMTEALALRLGSKGTPSDLAREWMDGGIVDMAAEATGYRGRLSTFAARENVLQNAFAPHSTSDFANIYLNALNKTLQGRYAQAMPTYRMIGQQMTFTDFRPHYVVRAGDFPQLQAIAEGGEIKVGTFTDNKETVTAAAYAVQIPFSRQMMVNDDLSAIAQVLASTGDSVALFEETTFYTTCMASNGPTLAETSRAVFNTTDVSKAGTASVIDAANLTIARAAMRKRTSKDGNKLNVTPAILLVGPDKETEAQQIVAPINPTTSAGFNPFSGALQVVVTPQITGNKWYLFADPSSVPNFRYGLLSGYTAPRLRIDEPFGYQGMSVSLEHDFGCGAIDFRGGFFNAGA